MRKLTIKRHKSIVGCLMKIKIYIEDHSASEIFINNIPCRKIGDLKNGKEKTFEIGEQFAKVFIIVDKFSKDYCNDFYELPEGNDDIYLSGKNHFNLANGNAFRFDNNESAAVLTNRKNGTRRGLGILIGALIGGAVIGFIAGFNLL